PQFRSVPKRRGCLRTVIAILDARKPAVRTSMLLVMSEKRIHAQIGVVPLVMDSSFLERTGLSRCGICCDDDPSCHATIACRSTIAGPVRASRRANHCERYRHHEACPTLTKSSAPRDHESARAHP